MLLFLGLFFRNRIDESKSLHNFKAVIHVVKLFYIKIIRVYIATPVCENALFPCKCRLLFFIFANLCVLQFITVPFSFFLLTRTKDIGSCLVFNVCHLILVEIFWLNRNFSFYHHVRVDYSFKF